MARSNQAWLNFSARGQAWTHFWGDAATEAGGSSTGTFAATLAAVTLSATGMVTVAGSMSTSLAAVTLEASGGVAVEGATSYTLAGPVLVATGAAEGGEPPPETTPASGYYLRAVNERRRAARLRAFRRAREH